MVCWHFFLSYIHSTAFLPIVSDMLTHAWAARRALTSTSLPFLPCVVLCMPAARTLPRTLHGFLVVSTA